VAGEGIKRVRELAGGGGTHRVLECVGTARSLETASGILPPDLRRRRDRTFGSRTGGRNDIRGLLTF